MGWITIGGKIRGATHILQDKPCQDAICLYPGKKNYSLVSIADGHGSSRCPYSDEGAETAVLSAGKILSPILERTDAFSILDANKEIHLPKQLEKQWKNDIKDLHVKKGRSADDNRVEENAFPFELYGTTLLILAAKSKFIYTMQIGDGDILVVGKDETVQWLIPPIPSEGSETYSLCMENCWQYMRTRIIPWDKKTGPWMFLLSTDGYANSFSETSGFLKAGADIYRLWQEKGADYLKDNLENWLNQSSADGSGDDISMALVLYVDT